MRCSARNVSSNRFRRPPEEERELITEKHAFPLTCAARTKKLITLLSRRGKNPARVRWIGFIVVAVGVLTTERERT